MRSASSPDSLPGWTCARSTGLLPSSPPLCRAGTGSGQPTPPTSPLQSASAQTGSSPTTSVTSRQRSPKSRLLTPLTCQTASDEHSPPSQARLLQGHRAVVTARAEPWRCRRKAATSRSAEDPSAVILSRGAGGPGCGPVTARFQRLAPRGLLAGGAHPTASPPVVCYRLSPGSRSPLPGSQRTLLRPEPEYSSRNRLYRVRRPSSTAHA